MFDDELGEAKEKPLLNIIKDDVTLSSEGMRSVRRRLDTEWWDVDK